MRLKSIALIFSLLSVPFLNSYSQSINPKWETDLSQLMDKFLECANGSKENLGCSSYVGESLAKVYKINALYSDKAKRYLMLNEMASLFSESSQWKLLGHAYEQKTLTEAQELANAHKAVVAVYTTEEGIKHVAIIVPGELQFSGTWGFQVPNSVSFVLNEPSKSYVSKGLSYAFARNMMKDVTLYSKNY
ncbi:hypothetical protein [Chryseosolibacter indicus]|uniref:Peptidase C39-like domain-containing protein n=1 Tax=Chryseosolibacter indicus TaxID=2782351 RepID=A0ABS5VQR0_9BACT|nr:hypothetical protein [Chryseosolibacter indicus]MBT1703686.1 hypothetical protein [Chryseosolibacter indicus]